MEDDTDLIEIDLSQVTNPRELQERLREALGFPHWYGHNWDAFWDAITGLVEMPARLRMVGWQDFASRLPHEADMLRKLLRDSQQSASETPTVIEIC